MKKAKDLRDARYALQELTASDPAAVANMRRWHTAFARLVTGHRRTERAGREPIFGSTFQMTVSEAQLPIHVTARSGIDQAMLVFDVDDAAGPPLGMLLVRKREPKSICHVGCRLWAPAGNGRALIVAEGDDGLIAFAYRPGEALREVAAPSADRLDGGYRRGWERLQHIVHSPELRRLKGRGHGNWMRSHEHQAVSIEIAELAA